MQQSSQSVFLIESIRPDWLPSRGLRWLYNLLVILITGLPAGLLLGYGVGYPVMIAPNGYFYNNPQSPISVEAFTSAGGLMWLGLALATLFTTGLAVRRSLGWSGAVLGGAAYGLAFAIPFGSFFGVRWGMYVAAAVAVLGSLLLGLAGIPLMHRAG